MNESRSVAPSAAVRDAARPTRPLTTLLIANRGEIAVRVARTARRLGIMTVAVYSDADRLNPHVAACDAAVPIGGLTPAESYLVIDKLIAAARKSGADAVHPGYGFLAENADFAAAVVAAGLVFVGPPASAIEAMGDKARARRRMAAAGIPVVPGYDGDDQGETHLLAEADRIGFPIMVKASAGGGGRGMRKVEAREGLASALQSARSEAEKAFGDGRLILERAVAEPRHVEIQVFADRHGNVVHLGERDCSVQRRHQKIIEEAPSPAVDAALRAAMGGAAVSVAREIGYQGAGTIEFLLDPEKRFYFMEMNTRLQVEHPVTELIIGVDLVEWQLRVARGETLPLAQDEIALNGHAVEVRLCAEDPADDFLPRTGQVLAWRSAPSVRCDHALADGLTVSPYYDSMLGKLIAHGATRAEAVGRLAHALDETVLLGVPTNRAFLARVLRHPAFMGGDVSTAFIETFFPENAARATEPDQLAWSLAAWLSVAAAPEAETWKDEWRGWTSGLPLAQPWRLEHMGSGGSNQEQRGYVIVKPDGAVLMDGDHTALFGRPAAPGTRADFDLFSAKTSVDGIKGSYHFAWKGDQLWLQVGGQDFVFADRRRQSAARAAAESGSDGTLRAPMNGRVVKALEAGATVAAGDAVLALEAMKMEHVIPAPRAGTLSEVAVKVGDQVTPGQILARIEPA
jgi:geranyl-CoA carboxylase alpha subunit